MVIIRFLLTALHLLVISILFGTILNAYIPPRVFGFLNLLSLAFPILIIANVLLLIFWIITWRKRSVIFLLLSLCFITPTRRWINYTSEKKEKPNLKLLSLNGKFGALGDDAIYNYINKQNADIVFLQEFNSDKKPEGFGYSGKNYAYIKIFSKFPISETGLIKTDVNNGLSIYADIKINGKTIRFVNIYMEPFFLEKKMVRPTSDMNRNEEKARKVLHMLIPTFKKHETEINQIKDFINASPYPVIVGGDFNAVPNSYEYYKISESLQDVFLKAGKGSGTSFHDFKFPLKIDHIFASESITPISYKVDRTVRISDHFPVIATFNIK